MFFSSAALVSGTHSSPKGKMIVLNSWTSLVYFPVQRLILYFRYPSISAWDTAKEKGTQTVNAIVLVELGGDDNDIVLDAQSEQ